jgi:hypothetical protein
MPARQSSSVDLPDPLGPMTARISPWAALTVAPRSAWVWPNDFTTPRASMIAPGWPATAVWPSALTAAPPG